jgi:protein O-mannosyl-transferase
MLKQKMQNDEDVTFKGLFIPFTTKKAILFIFLIGFVVFFSSLFNGFVGDDNSQLVDNISAHSVSNLTHFFTSGTFYNGSNKLIGVYYKPLLISVFASIYNIFGPNPFVFHGVQVFLHILNSSLLFIFFSRFLKKPYSFFISLIFLLHPINNESVFYISAMQENLFFLFGILAMNILTISKSIKSLLVISILLLLSLFSKETGILFIFISLIYVLINTWRRFVFLGLTSLGVMVLYLILRASSIGLFIVANNAPIDKLSLVFRFINVPEMIIFYFKQFIFPIDFSISYQWAYKILSFDHFFVPAAIDLLIFAVFAVGGIILYKKSKIEYFKLYLFFNIWLLIGLLFHMQIFPLDQTVADRWFYFPIVGLLGMIGVMFEAFSINFKKIPVIVIIVVIISLLSAITIVRGFDFKDSITLYKHDASVAKDSFSLENVLGLELMKQGKLEEARIHMEKSVALFPYFSNYDNLGELYVVFGDYKKAKQAYLNALKYGDYYMVYEDLGGLTLITGDVKENMQFLASALRKFPKDSKLWIYLAVVSYKNGDSTIAKYAINQAYTLDKINPEIPNIYYSIMNDKPLNLTIKKLPQ